MTTAMNRPSFDVVLEAIESLKPSDASNARRAERVGVTIPGEMITQDGTRIPIRLRDVSTSGIGFFHHGPIKMEEVTLKMITNSYYVSLKWCVPCSEDLYISGGPILKIQTPRTTIDMRPMDQRGDSK